MSGMLAVGSDADFEGPAGGAGRSMFAAASTLGGLILLLTALRLVGRRLGPASRPHEGTRAPAKDQGD